jgi:NOL1/NOP2/fmu family ribosome biogenesis protein
MIRAFPANLSNDFWKLRETIPVKNFGLEMGEAIRDKFIPSHALALSKLVNKNVPRLECSLEEAISYLQKGDFRPQIDGKGWKLVSYKGNELGWINALPGRINNYYPRDWRILKQLPTPPAK